MRLDTLVDLCLSELLCGKTFFIIFSGLVFPHPMTFSYILHTLAISAINSMWLIYFLCNKESCITRSSHSTISPRFLFRCLGLQNQYITISAHLDVVVRYTKSLSIVFVILDSFFFIFILYQILRYVNTIHNSNSCMRQYYSSWGSFALCLRVGL